MVHSTPVVDEIVAGEGSVVLVGVGAATLVIRLSSVGTAIRELARAGISLEALVHQLSARFGAPEGDAADVVRALVEELCERGVVTVIDADA